MRLMTIILAALMVAAGCEKKPPQADAPHPRIVSLSPAITDMLFEMGLGDHVVGVTTYCITPPGQSRPVVGDRSRVSSELILSVKPDVLLIQQNPEDFGAVKKLAPEVRIEHLKIETVADIAEAVQQVGRAAGNEKLGQEKAGQFQDDLQKVRNRVAGKDRPAVLLLMGYDKPATGGAGTFIDEMITAAGGTNAATVRGYSGWKSLNRENIMAMAPQVILCQVDAGSEQAARNYFKTLPDLPAVASGRVFIITDRRWTIPGLHTARLIGELAEMIHGGEKAASRQGENK